MRARFTLPQIRRKALEIVDREGVSGLSMRSLAAALGTGPMTLYNYVKDREGIEELVVEEILAQIEIPPASGGWRQDAEAIATALWRAVRSHPSATALALTRRPASAAGYAPAEALITVLEGAGLAELDLLAAFRSVLGFVMGAAQVELTAPRAARVGELAGQNHPHMAALAQVSRRSTAEGDFARGLGFLLDGIEAHAAAAGPAQAAGQP